MGTVIETYPQDLRCLKQGSFYLELIGDQNPILNTTLTQVTMPDQSEPGKPQHGAPIYEFLWTLGHLDQPKKTSWEIFLSKKRLELGDVDIATSVIISLFFGKMNGWRFNEPIATVKYMSPAPGGGDLFKRVGKELQGASKVAGLIPGGSTASKWMDAAAGLQSSSLPQAGDFKWSVTQATLLDSDGIMSGVVWSIPKKMFKVLNGQLTGGLAVSFLPANKAGQVTGVHNPNSTPGNSERGIEVSRGKVLLRAEFTGRRGLKIRKNICPESPCLEVEMELLFTGTSAD